MPVSPSSPIHPLVDQLVAVADDHEVTGRDLLAALSQVPDPRARRGVRHQLTTILGLAVCGVLTGARSFAAIAEWALDASPQVLAALGIAGCPPCESTVRRTLQKLGGDDLDTVIGDWTAARADRSAVRRAIAVDGKTLRGALRPDGRARHLMAAIDHHAGVVLGQVDVDGKTNEIPMFSQLLDRIDDLTGVVVTADAMHAQRTHADYLVLHRGAHYILTVKGNQPKLRGQLKALPWANVPLADTRVDRGHGRAEKRTCKLVTVSTGILFPHAVQAIQITRKTRKLTSRKWRTETVYAVTSLTPTQVRPDQLAEWIRGHWCVENRLHWVRDVTYGEDHSQVRTGNGPRTMASLRNLAINILRMTGTSNIAAALRHHARDPTDP
jgi:predicted transposase YbfD/YdcC